MSNLGKYQVLVELAKKLGGPDNLIKTIGDGAVAKATPRIFLKGVGAATTVFGFGVAVYKVTQSKLHSRTARAGEAEAELRAALAGSEDSTVADLKHDDDAPDPG